MIRETYKGRKIVVSRNKNYGARWQIKVNGVVVATGSRSESDELTWAKGTIDAVDAAPKGEARYAADWYAPGTFEINDNGHVVEIGEVCSCSYCAPIALVVDEPTPDASPVVDESVRGSDGREEHTVASKTITIELTESAAADMVAAIKRNPAWYDDPTLRRIVAAAGVAWHGERKAASAVRVSTV